MTDAATEARWDHARDLRKHEPRPEDDQITPELVAKLVRAPTTSFHQAVSLIASFATATASSAVVKALQEQHDRTIEVIRGSSRTSQQIADDLLAEHRTERGRP